MKDSRPGDWLVGGGEVGEIVRSKDWSTTPLGPIELWPQSLRTTVSLCLASRFPTVIYWGREFTCVYNDGYVPILGSKHPWALGRAVSEVWSEIWAIIAPMLEGVVTTGIATWSENKLLFMERRGYSEECYFTFSFAPVLVESGTVGGVFTAVTETTRQVIGERRLQTLRELATRTSKAATVDDACRLAAEALSENQADLPFVLLYLLDRDGEHARLAGVTGLPAGLSASPTTVELTSMAPDVAWPLAHVAKIRQPAMVDELERRFGALPLREGMMIPRSALVLPVGSPGDRRVLGLLVAGISPRLDLEEMYRSFLDLVTGHVASAVASVQALQEAKERAEALGEIDRAKTAFFANVSHEFRTPLTLMLGPLEDELEEQNNPLPPTRRERLETAHRNTLRLLKLVNTLLDFSRIEAGRARPSYDPTDLAALTADLASMFRSAVEKAGLALTVDCPPLPELLYVDRDMWEKVVLNLLSNAFKHTFEGGITVTLRWCGDHAELAVADSGVGIPETELPRLFERFHQVKGARSRTHEGTGIGLALVHELVGLHGGSVRVESHEDKGSTFVITVKKGRVHLPTDRIGAERTLASTATNAVAYVQEAMHWLQDVPQAPAAALTPKEADVAVDILPAAQMSGRRARILWSDDNADMRDYVRRLLADRYDVLAVPDGASALAAARENPPDLVLTDVMMPRLDGLGLLRELRADARTRTIPVILLSARAGEESAVEGLDAGADDYLVKPFTARELLARVRTHLELAQVRREWAEELEQKNEALRRAHDELEMRVQERTTALAAANKSLKAEIVERKRADTVFREIEERFHILVDGVRGHAIFMLAPDGRVMSWNEGARAIKGYDADEIIGQHISRFYSDEDVAKDKPNELLRRAATEGRCEDEGWRMRKDGSRFWADVTLTALHAEDGSLRGFAKVTRDITERKRAEEQLLRKTGDLETLLFVTSHDLREPLRSIENFSRMVHDRYAAHLDDKGRDFLRRIVRGAQRMDQLMTDILTLSRAQRMELPAEEVEGESIVREALRQLEDKIKEIGATVRVAKDLPRLQGNRTWATQGVYNLIANALKFTRNGEASEVEIASYQPTVEDGPVVGIVVRDRGPGVAPEHAERIFQLFQRAVGREVEGTGAGLAIVRQVAERHGGRAWVQPREGGGSEFILTFGATNRSERKEAA